MGNVLARHRDGIEVEGMDIRGLRRIDRSRM